MDRIELLLQLYDGDPSDPFTQFAIGFEYQKQERFDEALKWYESILSMAPDYTGVYYHLGKLYLKLGRREDAEEIFKKGIQVCTKVHESKDCAELQGALMELEDD